MGLYSLGKFVIALVCFSREFSVLIDGLLEYQVGTDIEDFKCSWLVVKALELCNEEQKKLLFVRKFILTIFV